MLGLRCFFKKIFLILSIYLFFLIKLTTCKRYIDGHVFCSSQAPFPNSGFVNGFGTAAHYKTGSNSLNIGRPFNRNRFVVLGSFILTCCSLKAFSSLFFITPSAMPLFCITLKKKLKKKMHHSDFH